MKKSKYIMRFLWVVPIIVIGLIIGGITAYAAMKDTDEKKKLVQIGNLQTSIEEIFTKPAEISPGQFVNKQVKVKNTGTVDQVVRVMVHPEISVVDNGETQLLPAEIGKEIILDLNSTKWKKGEDGYYYYLTILKSGKTNVTENLFTKVKLEDDLGYDFNKASINLLLKVEAVNCVDEAFVDAWWEGNVPTADILKSIYQQLTAVS